MKGSKWTSSGGRFGARYDEDGHREFFHSETGARTLKVAS